MRLAFVVRMEEDLSAAESFPSVLLEKDFDVCSDHEKASRLFFVVHLDASESSWLDALVWVLEMAPQGLLDFQLRQQVAWQHLIGEVIHQKMKNCVPENV